MVLTLSDTTIRLVAGVMSAVVARTCVAPLERIKMEHQVRRPSWCPSSSRCGHWPSVSHRAQDQLQDTSSNTAVWNASTAGAPEESGRTHLYSCPRVRAGWACPWGTPSCCEAAPLTLLWVGARADQDGDHRAVHRQAAGPVDDDNSTRGGRHGLLEGARVSTVALRCSSAARPCGSTRLPPGGIVRVSGRANAPSWVYRRRLTGRLWNTPSCLTAAPLTHSLTRPAGYTGDGSRADAGTPPAASRPLPSLTH